MSCEQNFFFRIFLNLQNLCIIIAAFSLLKGNTSPFLHLELDLIAFNCLNLLEQLFIDSLISVDSSLSIPIEFYLFMALVFKFKDQKRWENYKSKILNNKLVFLPEMIKAVFIMVYCLSIRLSQNIINIVMEHLNSHIHTNQEDGVAKHKKIEKEVIIVVDQIIKQVEFIISSGPYQSYFLGQKNKKVKLKQMHSKYGQTIHSKLVDEIQFGVTKVSKTKVDYKIHPKPKSNTEQDIQNSRIKLNLQKKQAIEQLNQIIKQENSILIKRNSLLKQSRSLSKSQLYVPENPQWKEHLISAIKKNKQLDKSFEQKSEQVQQKIKSIHQQKIKMKMESLQKQRLRNIKQLQKRKHRQEQQKEKVLQNKKKCQQFVQKMKPTKYRFEEMGEKGEQKLKILQEERQKRIRQYKEMKHKKEWKDLQQHQQKYFSVLNQKREEWIRKFQTSFKNKNHKKYNSSIFAQKLKQQQEQKEFEQKQRQTRKKQFQQKIKTYSSSVLQNHMPRKFIQSPHLAQKDNRTIRQSLNRIEQRQKGLMFLNEAKKKHKQITEIKNNNQIKAASSLPIIKLPVYKDYLRQQPKRLKDETSSTRFYSVLTEKKGQWAANAKSILERMGNTKKSDDKLILQSAFKKIQLLNAMM